MLRLVKSLHLVSGCEIYVAIIVASMPAFASFFKGSMPGAFWLTKMGSILSRCKTGISKSGRCAELSPIPSTGVCPSREDDGKIVKMPLDKGADVNTQDIRCSL